MFRDRCLAGLVAAALVLLAGCRSVPPSGADLGGSSAPAAALNKAQTADVQLALGHTLEARGELQQAAQFYSQAAKNDPLRAEVWARLAVVSDKDGMFAESFDAHRRAIQLDPNNPDLNCNLGYSYYLQQQWADAEPELRRAIALKPDHQRAHNNLGLVLARAGRGPEAFASFQRAGCSAPDAHTNLAYASTLNGDWVAARTQYKRALELDPSSKTARQGLESLEVLAAKFSPPGEEKQPGGGIVPAIATVPAAGSDLEVIPLVP